MGTICVLDPSPKTLSHQQIDGLRLLSDQVVEMLEGEKTIKVEGGSPPAGRGGRRKKNKDSQNLLLLQQQQPPFLGRPIFSTYNNTSIISL